MRASRPGVTLRPRFKGERMRSHPLFMKLFAIVAIVGLLMLALGQIDHLAAERQMRFHEAEHSIEASQAGRQSVLGPALLARCVEEWPATIGEGKDRKTMVEKREFMLTATPQQLDVQSTVTMEPRYRGLFKVNTYVARATLRARWESLAPLRARREHAESRLACGAPVLTVAVSDARGIRQAALAVDGRPVAVQPGTGHAIHPRGFHAVLADARADADGPLAAQVTLELVGAAAMAVAPIGGDTVMTLHADWPHPSFGGRFLPVSRDVRADGFDATWRVSSLATTAPG